MNPITGETAQLDSVAAQRFVAGDAITAGEVEGLASPPADERHLREALREALDRAEGARMVAVSRQVAQRQALGGRELARRRRRR